MFVADRDLVALTEGLVVSELEHFAADARRLYPDSDVRALRVGGGCALYGADVVPFSEAAGIGLTDKIEDSQIDVLEAFFDDAQVPANALVPSLGDPLLAPMLAARGWMPNGFEDVLVVALGDEGSVSFDMVEGADCHVRVVDDAEVEQWAECVALGFSADGDPSAVERRFSRVVAARPNTVQVWAWSDGRPVATGELHIERGVGWLSADTTLPDYRGRGIQQALQRERVRMAEEAGCKIAVTEAVPASTSHRNAQRCGFQIAFTRLIMHKDFGT